MADWEKVKYDIERCTSLVPGSCQDCSHFAQREHFPVCMDELLKDTLALLKAQEPRVIRLQDAEAMHLCWIETKYPHTMRPARIMRYCDDSPNITIFSIHQAPTDWPVCEFGIKWRCWDKEPTNEQMEEVKWNDSER